MLVERLTFRTKYGHGDELVALFREMAPRLRQMGVAGGRIYTDATGPMFTVQVESEFADWSAYAAFMAKSPEMFGDPAWQQWFARMTEATEAGDRQLFHAEGM